MRPGHRAGGHLPVRRVAAGLALALGSLAGCPERSSARLDATTSDVWQLRFPVSLNRNLDLLFVIDDSGSMAEEQASLARNFAAFMDALGTIEGGLPDVHIGVVSTDVGSGGVNVGGCSSATRPDGDDGALLTSGCPGVTAPYLEDIALPTGARQRNYRGDLAEVFGCMARLGTTGCGFEAPLEAAARALAPGKNPGFLRPEAMLAVIFVTDEDDCSARPGGALFADPDATVASPLGPRTSFRCWEFGVECDDAPNPRAFGTYTGCRPRAASPYLQDVQRYVDQVKGLKDDPRKVAVAAIVGDVDDARTSVVAPDPDDPGRPMLAPSCSSPSGVAVPAHRLKAFLDGFPERNHTTSICDADLTDALVPFGQMIKIALGATCVEPHLADRDPARPGLQPECAFTEVTHPDGPDRTEAVLPACDATGGATPCWRFEIDPAGCSLSPGHQRIVIDHAGASVPHDTYVEVQCVACDPATAPAGTCP